MSIHRRLRRLEQHARVIAGARPCPACGGPSDWRGWRPAPGDMKVRVVRGEGERPPGPDRCPACGRMLAVTVLHDRAG